MISHPRRKKQQFKEIGDEKGGTGEDLFQEENAAFQHEGGKDITRIKKGGEKRRFQNWATKTTLCSLQKIQSLGTLVFFGEPVCFHTSLSGTAIKLSPTEKSC